MGGRKNEFAITVGITAAGDDCAHDVRILRLRDDSGFEPKERRDGAEGEARDSSACSRLRPCHRICAHARPDTLQLP